MTINNRSRDQSTGKPVAVKADNLKSFSDSFDENEIAKEHRVSLDENVLDHIEKEVAQQVFPRKIEICKDEDVYGEFRRRTKKLLEKISIVKTVEDVARSIASSSVAAAFNQTHDIIFSNFERSLFNHTFRNSNYSNSIQPPVKGKFSNNEDELVNTHQGHCENFTGNNSVLEAKFNAITVSPEGAPSILASGVQHQSTELTRQVEDHSLKYQSGILIDQPQILVEMVPANGYLLEDNREEHVSLTSSIINTNKDDKKRVLTLHLHKSDRLEPSTNDVNVSITDSFDEYCGESMNPYEPLSFSALNSLSTDSKDPGSNQRDEVYHYIDKKLKKMCSEINKRIETIDEHVVRVTKNCSAIYQKYEKLQHQQNSLTCQVEDVRKVQVIQAQRIVEFSSNHEFAIKPLSESLDETKQVIIKQEQLIRDVVTDVAVVKKENKRFLDEIMKVNLCHCCA